MEDQIYQARPLTRRAFLLGTVALATSSLLLACGGDDDDAPGTTSTAASTGVNGVPSTAEATGSTAGTPAAEGTSGTSGGSGSDLPGVTLNLRSIGELVNVTPLEDAGAPDELIINIIYSKLVMQYPADPQDVLPDLATDWEISDDGLEYTFSLRQGAQWHKDYGEVTANDVVWSIERARNPDEASTAGDAFVNVSSVTAPDDYTAVITLSQPEPAFLYTVVAPWGYISNQTAIEEKGDAYSTDPVGSGPYVMTEWIRGQEAILVKHPGHWLHEGNVEEAHFKFLLDDSVAELALRSGDLDGGYFESTEIQRLVVDNPDLTSLSEPANEVQQLYFPMTEGAPATDVRVRRAIAISLNRELIAEQALSGMAYPAHSPICPGHPGYLNTEYFPYDPDQARELLAEAGYADGFDMEAITYNLPPSPDILTVVAAQLEEIGINVTVTVLERARAFERWRARDFDMLTLPLGRDTAEPVIYSYYTSDGIPYPNTALYDGVAELAQSLKTEADPDERVNLIEQIGQKIAEDVASIPIIYKQIVFGMRKGIEPFPIGTSEKFPLWLVTVSE